ncbi:MAG: hypothetical protein R3B09_13420 [Nannocystaceae bacterium]
MPRLPFLPLAATLALALAGCSGGDDSGTSETTASSTDDSTTDGTTTASTETSTASTTDASSTATGTASDSTTQGTTTSDTTTTTSTTDMTTSTTDMTTSTTDMTTTDGTGGGVCGDGNLDQGEVCDDGNTKTEFPQNDAVPHAYNDGDCLDRCDLVEKTCGDGNVDPGEGCDDGNTNGLDTCSTSCTVNDGGFHSACKRECGGMDCSANDVLDGTIVGCNAVMAPQGTEKVCYESGEVNIPNIINKKLYFADGECAVVAQKCEGLFCPGYTKIGDYDGFNNCPAGTTLTNRVTDMGGVKVSTKVCRKTCESDIECRWNAHDDFWKKPGQIRCQATADSAGVKICADAQN